MEMLLDVCLLIVGIAIVLFGADKFTDAASSMARRWNVSEMVIGLTVVAMGTSMPEFVVSFLSALEGSADMSVGNVVGSNVFNSLLIIGVSALFISLTLTKKLLTRDVMFVLFSSLILVALGLDGVVSRLEGLVLLMCFCMYMSYSYLSSKQDTEQESNNTVMYAWGKTIFFLMFGIGCLVGGGQLLVSSATSFAMALGMSERVVGLTILAAGTSLPELATSVVAARKGSRGLALGNVVGSCLFNVFFILGVSSVICPLVINGIGVLDWLSLVGSAIALLVFGGTGRKITRGEGVVMLLLYILYMIALVIGWKIVL